MKRGPRVGWHCKKCSGLLDISNQASCTCCSVALASDIAEAVNTTLSERALGAAYAETLKRQVHGAMPSTCAVIYEHLIGDSHQQHISWCGEDALSSITLRLAPFLIAYGGAVYHGSPNLGDGASFRHAWWLHLLFGPLYLSSLAQSQLTLPAQTFTACEALVKVLLSSLWDVNVSYLHGMLPDS